jgi:hypothetical protein
MLPLKSMASEVTTPGARRHLPSGSRVSAVNGHEHAPRRDIDQPAWLGWRSRGSGPSGPNRRASRLATGLGLVDRDLPMPAYRVCGADGSTTRDVTLVSARPAAANAPRDRSLVDPGEVAVDDTAPDGSNASADPFTKEGRPSYTDCQCVPLSVDIWTPVKPLAADRAALPDRLRPPESAVPGSSRRLHPAHACCADEHAATVVVPTPA